MKIKSFLKLLNRKVNKYDKKTSNPFGNYPIKITLVWIDDIYSTTKKNFN